jgi:hypothetical protein
MVKGFKENAIYRFFELQNSAKPKEIFDNYSQLPEMCKVPMIAAILCSICKHNLVYVELTKDENSTLFIIFDNFVKMLTNMASEKRPQVVFNKRTDAINAAGKFALITVKSNR